MSSNTKEDKDFERLSPISDEQKEQDVTPGQSFINMYLKADYGEKSFLNVTPYKEEMVTQNELSPLSQLVINSTPSPVVKIQKDRDDFLIEERDLKNLFTSSQKKENDNMTTIVEEQSDCSHACDTVAYCNRNRPKR